MMQFTQTPPPPFYGPCSDLTMNKNSSYQTHPWPADTNCMEQLLVHCAIAIDSNDSTLAQQILWVLNNIATPDGDSNQRLGFFFLRALIARAAKTGSCKMLPSLAYSNSNLAIPTHKFSVIELATFIDLTPFHRFGFSAANAAIIDAVEGFSVIHIIDFSVTHCMQIPTLIDSLANRPEGPPFIRLTVTCTGENFPPLLNFSYEELGSRLVNFARSRNVGMEFRIIPSSSLDGYSFLIEQVQSQRLVFLEGEALVINCQMSMHYVPDETLTLGTISETNPTPYSLDSSPSSSFRSIFLNAIRGLDPTIVILVDEDADFTSNNLVSRLRSAFNFLWIPFDSVETFLPRGSKQRLWYEADICWKIDNVIANEGVQRVERLEPKSKWVHRMRSTDFQAVPFGEEAVLEVKNMLDEHAAGWGLKKDEDGLVLTWKGHNVVFASAWVPS
ncbi:GRAS family transcription factor [Tasmannia lanceolata]|uniref:GRAS family transcription factor n=1 Tax=Tasmannia lanceolata TaxID=3420 RepID=UPI004062B80F